MTQDENLEELARESPLMTPAEVARLLRMSKSQVYEAIARGELPSVKIGRIWVPRAALARLFTECALPEGLDMAA